MAIKSFVFRFDDIEVREREFTLVKGGQVLAIEPKAFRALLFLLHNPQKVVSKEELLNSVWGVAAVTDGSLTRCIWLLRRLLGDDINQPRYIATVATVGYRFIGKVEVSEDAPGEPEAAQEPSELNGVAKEVGSRKRLGGWALAGGGVFALCIAAAIWYLHRPLPLPRVTEYTQLTHDSRYKFLAGTDGVRLFLDTYLGPSQMPVSGGEIARIPIALPTPFLQGVSPDGSTLLANSAFGDPGSLWSVRALGNSLRRLTDGDIVSVAWSPDGNSVAYSTLTGDVDVMRSDGTGAHTLASIPMQLGRLLLDRTSWSPDGSRIRFDRDYKIYEISPDGSGLHPMLQGWRPSSMQCCGQWTPDGQFFVFLSWDHPRNFSLLPPAQMWVLDERRGPFKGIAEPSQLTSGPIRWDWPAPSKDGKKIFARGATLSGELVRFDTKSGQLQPYLGGISAEDVCFSPDGRFTAYVTFPEGILWKANRDGSNPTQLTDPPLYPNRPRWSPDGSQILFFAASRLNEARSYLVSAQGGTPRLLLPDDKESNGNPDWSPDGSKIVFDSVDRTLGKPKHHHLRIVDLASRQITTLPEEEWNPLWSPDGRFIAAESGESSSLMVYEFETKRWSVLQKGGTDRPTWSRDSQFIYFLANDPNPGVFRIRPSGGKAERVADLKGFQLTGVWSDGGFGLDPTDAPLLLRNIGSDDIYALTLDQK